MSYQTTTALSSSVPKGHLTLKGTGSPRGVVTRKLRLLALLLPTFIYAESGSWELSTDLWDSGSHLIDSNHIYVNTKLRGKKSNNHSVCARVLEACIIFLLKLS